MKRLKIGMLVCMLAIVLATLLVTKIAEAAPLTCGMWSAVTSPNTGTGNNYLNGVATVSASDVWAVGEHFNSNEILQTLIENWNGTSWKVVTSPNVGTSHNFLNSVTVDSTGGIWAVGDYLNSNGFRQTLIEHWDGTSWQVVSSPNAGSSDNYLNGVVANSASGVWAVGDYLDSSSIYQTLLEHWDGTSWQVVNSPNVGSSNNMLSSVAADSASDIWAVGSSLNSNSVYQTLIEHWNGTGWQVVNSPNAGSSDNYLNGVAATSTSGIWAVGNSLNSNGILQTLIEHWDGTSWQVVNSPNVGTGGNMLNSVAIVSTSEIWAVGDYFNTNNIYKTLIEKWNGTSWKITKSLNGVGGSNFLNSVATVPTGGVWAVGDYLNSSHIGRTLTEFYC